MVLPDPYPAIHTEERTIRKVMGEGGREKIIYAGQNVRKKIYLWKEKPEEKIHAQDE